MANTEVDFSHFIANSISLQIDSERGEISLEINTLISLGIISRHLTCAEFSFLFLPTLSFHYLLLLSVPLCSHKCRLAQGPLAAHPERERGGVDLFELSNVFVQFISIALAMLL